MRSCNLRALTAVALVLTTTFVTIPLSAADFSTVRPVLGSVSAAGSVELRGVGVSEGTLFSGDNIRAREKGYAKVLIGTNKIELNEKTDVNVKRDGEVVKIAMNSGTVGFTAHTALRIDVLPFEVIASDDASGNVAIMSAKTAGVRAINGKVTVRNLKTSESFVILKGQERLLGLTDGVHSPSLGELASNVPGPVPAPNMPPQTPAGKTSGGLAMDTGAWLAVVGGAAVAGVAIWGLVVAMNNRDDIKDLKASITTLNGTITANQTANQAAIAASQAAATLALKNVSNAAAISNAVAQQQAQLAAISALAGQTQLALNAAGNATGAATAASLSSQAAASQARLNTLQAQILVLQAQLSTGGGTQAQINALLQLEETERTTSNGLATQLNALLNANRNVNGVPGGTVGLTGGPTLQSASVPV